MVSIVLTSRVIVWQDVWTRIVSFFILISVTVVGEFYIFAKFLYWYNLSLLGNIFDVTWKLLIVIVMLIGRGCVEATNTDSDPIAWGLGCLSWSYRRFWFFNLSSLMRLGSSLRLRWGWLLIEPDLPTQQLLKARIESINTQADRPELTNFQIVEAQRLHVEMLRQKLFFWIFLITHSSNDLYPLFR